MLMLVEQFKKYGHQVISANTDGLTLYIPRTELENVRRIYKVWEEMSRFNLEESFYKFYLRRDVNNYLAVYEDGKCKYKGVFEPQEKKDLLKAFKYPIVTKAINDFILHGVPVDQTIRNHQDIYDFCFSQKCSKQYTNYLQKVRRRTKLTYGRDLLKN
jgi:hypothetical protein